MAQHSTFDSVSLEVFLQDLDIVLANLDAALHQEHHTKPGWKGTITSTPRQLLIELSTGKPTV
jgi:hypothetical protein